MMMWRLLSSALLLFAGCRSDDFPKPRRESTANSWFASRRAVVIMYGRQRRDRLAQVSCAFFLLVISIPSLSRAQDQNGVLRKAYRLSKGLATNDRAFFLRALAFGTREFAPEKDLLSWCQDLFDTSRLIEMGWNRFVLSKNAALACAPIEPKWSLKMLMSLGIPPPAPDGDSPEDVRTDAAGRGLTNHLNSAAVEVPGIMELYYRRYGRKRLKDLRRLARHLGDTGVYPYDGWRTPIEDLHAHGRHSQVDELFSECLWYYRRGSRFKNESEVFLRLLQSVQGKISGTLYQEGRESYLAFNPKFDFNAPPEVRTWTRPPRIAPELTPLVQGLTIADNGGSGDYPARLFHFLVEVQKLIEVGLTTPDQILERVAGYEQLSDVAQAAGRHAPAVFFEIVLNDIPSSPHREVLQSYLLLHLAIGMSSTRTSQKRSGKIKSGRKEVTEGRFP